MNNIQESKQHRPIASKPTPTTQSIFKATILLKIPQIVQQIQHYLSIIRYKSTN